MFEIHATFGIKKIIHCKNCKFFDKDSCWCDRWNRSMRDPFNYDEGQGYCAWAIKGKYDYKRSE